MLYKYLRGVEESPHHDSYLGLQPQREPRKLLGVQEILFGRISLVPRDEPAAAGGSRIDRLSNDYLTGGDDNVR